MGHRGCTFDQLNERKLRVNEERKVKEADVSSVVKDPQR
jgi:hypothetical protein